MAIAPMWGKETVKKVLVDVITVVLVLIGLAIKTFVAVLPTILISAISLYLIKVFLEPITTLQGMNLLLGLSVLLTILIWQVQYRFIEYIDSHPYLSEFPFQLLNFPKN